MGEKRSKRNVYCNAAGSSWGEDNGGEYPQPEWLAWLISKVLRCDSCCVTSVMAAVSIANIVKSSLGPVGLDKMLVDEVGVSHRHGSENWYLHKS